MVKSGFPECVAGGAEHGLPATRSFICFGPGRLRNSYVKRQAEMSNKFED